MLYNVWWIRRGNVNESALDVVRKIAEEKHLAVAFLLSCDRSKFGWLIESMQNDCLKGNDWHPKTLDEAFNLVVNWKQDPRNMVKLVNAGGDGVTFLQNGQEDDVSSDSEHVLVNDGSQKPAGGGSDGKKDKSRMKC